MLLIITSTRHGLFSFINIDDLERHWTPKRGSLANYSLQRTFPEWIVTKWLEIDQENPRMKFLASNVDFGSPLPNPLDSRRQWRSQKFQFGSLSSPFPSSSFPNLSLPSFSLPLLPPPSFFPLSSPLPIPSSGQDASLYQGYSTKWPLGKLFLQYQQPIGYSLN